MLRRGHIFGTVVRELKCLFWQVQLIFRPRLGWGWSKPVSMLVRRLDRWIFPRNTMFMPQIRGKRLNVLRRGQCTKISCFTHIVYCAYCVYCVYRLYCAFNLFPAHMRWLFWSTYLAPILIIQGLRFRIQVYRCITSCVSPSLSACPPAKCVTHVTLHLVTRISFHFATLYEPKELIAHSQSGFIIYWKLKKNTLNCW